MNMKKGNTNRSIMPAIVAVGLLLGGCGQKIAGTYNLIQSSSSGYATSYGTNQVACEQISLNISESGSAVSASGSNTCWTETLTGTESGGVIQATLIEIPVTSTGTSTSYYGSSQGCIYTGTLTISNNVITGSLENSTSGYAGLCTPITINGTKTN
jgi:hypothetical protein